MSWWLASMSLADLFNKVGQCVVPNIRQLRRSTVRVCGACTKRSLFIALGEDEEFHLCLRCRANLRYEMLARYLRSAYPNIQALDVLELDDRSPLRQYLGRAKTYTRSYYRPGIAPGAVRADGATCEDITHLSYRDGSLDLIVSSDVLEHVLDVASAFRESARVLRLGGAHVFTVPPRAATGQRAAQESGRVVFLQPAEYHRDPLDPRGILTYWDFGPDMPQKFSTESLGIRPVAGPLGRSGRIVWEARKKL
jgi:SAM-dependent methyltransferase